MIRDWLHDLVQEFDTALDPFGVQVEVIQTLKEQVGSTPFSGFRIGLGVSRLSTHPNGFADLSLCLSVGCGTSVVSTVPRHGLAMALAEELFGFLRVLARERQDIGVIGPAIAYSDETGSSGVSWVLGHVEISKIRLSPLEGLDLATTRIGEIISYATSGPPLTLSQPSSDPIELVNLDYGNPATGIEVEIES